MTDTIPKTDKATPAASTDADLLALFEWLATPQSHHAADEILPLRDHWTALRISRAAWQQRIEALDRLYARSDSVVTELMPTLKNVSLPVPRKIRERVRSLQELLETLIDVVQIVVQTIPGDPSAHVTVRQAHRLAAWRSLNSLAQHLLISHLIAAPAGVGIWHKLHCTYTAAQQLLATSFTPEGESESLQQVYTSALVLGCSQPDSFTSTEVDFIASYLQHFARYVDPLDEVAPDNTSGFWVDLLHDSPAFPCSRKAAPAKVGIRYFSCEPLAERINQQLEELNAGSTAQKIDLPDFAGTPAGRGVMTRLTGYWGSPGKRRFPHRRRNHRAEVCAGLHRVWLLFQLDQATQPEVSTWMITNQSPDGYAIMHVGGKTGRLAVGEITAIRSESENNWQICLVRWALSENPEHLEMGLQILAPQAIPAILTLPSERDISEHLPVLLLPEVPTLRSTEMLVTHSGALANRGQRHVLIIAQGNIKVREIKTIRVEEQTSSVEVFVIESDVS